MAQFFFHAWTAYQAIQIMCTILTLTLSVINGWKKNRGSCKHQQLWASHLYRQDSLLKDTNHHSSGAAVTWDGHRKPLLLLSIARRSVQGLSCIQACESGLDFQTPVQHVLLYPFSGTGYLLVANLAAVAVCSVGVGTTVDWATSGGCIFSASATCQ